jgi:hypothetical protein
LIVGDTDKVLTPAFNSLILPAVMDTSSHDLVGEFFAPLLSRATRYDRGVGFFASSWLRINAPGMVAFAGSGGRARWVTSPIFAADDWEALQLGDAARDDTVLRQALERCMAVFVESLTSSPDI